MAVENGRYALVIGNSQYTDETLKQLITPAQDAEALVRVLKDPAIGNFKVDVKLDAGSHQLCREIEQFFGKRKTTDILLVYFSGHGLIGDDNELYLAVKDTEKSILTSTSIPSSFIRKSIRKSYAGSKVIILDCCYSGAIADEMLAKGPPEAKFGKQFVTGKGVVFLSASTAWQYAFQETEIEKLAEGGQSLFTRFLVQGLETGEADLDCDGIITVNELFRYVYELVCEVTPNQTPEMSGVSQQGDIVIATTIGRSKPGGVPVTRQDNVQHVLIEGTFQLGCRHYQEKEWASAIEWFTAVVQQIPTHQEARYLLEEAKKQASLEVLYNQGQAALADKDWETARDRFQKILDIDPGNKSAKDLYQKAQLPELYALALEQYQSYDWDDAIATMSTIIELDPHYEDVSSLLKSARQKKRLEEDYQWASNQYRKAKRTNIEADWLEVINLFNDIVKRDSQYKMAAQRAEQAQRRLDFLQLYRQGQESFNRKRWRKAIKFFKQAQSLQTQDSYLADKCPDLPDKLNQAQEKQKAIIPSFLRFSIAPGVIIAVLIAIFSNQFAAVGNFISNRLVGAYPSPTPTISIKTLDKIELWLDGGLLNLEDILDLTAGKAVTLEVKARDTDGKLYNSDEFACHWSVAPLGKSDQPINTDLCKILYVPSWEYHSQTIVVEVEGLDQQFRPTDPVSIKFNITD